MQIAVLQLVRSEETISHSLHSLAALTGLQLIGSYVFSVAGVATNQQLPEPTDLRKKKEGLGEKQGFIRSS